MFIEDEDLEFNEGNFKRLKEEAKSREAYIKILLGLIDELKKMNQGGGDKMSPESICCSVEIAKNLEEAGWDKETVFVWLAQCNGSYRLWPIENIGYELNPMINFYYAPTSAEIELPIEIQCICYCKNVLDEHSKYWCLDEHSKYWCMEVFDEEEDRIYTKDMVLACSGPKYCGENHSFTLPGTEEAYTEVESKARAWLYLKKRGLIK